MESCQSILTSWVWGCTEADQTGEGACGLLSTARIANIGHVHRMDHLLHGCGSPGKHMAPGCTMARKQAGRGSVILRAMFCYVLLRNPTICKDATLRRPTSQSTVVHPVHPFMETISPDGCSLFQQQNIYGSGKVWRAQVRDINLWETLERHLSANRTWNWRIDARHHSTPSGPMPPQASGVLAAEVGPTKYSSCVHIVMPGWCIYQKIVPDFFSASVPLYHQFFGW